MLNGDILRQVNDMIADIDKLELDNMSNIRARKQLESAIATLEDKIKNDKNALDITTHAIELLRGVSDNSVKDAYKFLQDSLNDTLARTFKNTIRRIELEEYTRSNQYPQLSIKLFVGNGRYRTLKNDSGHGLAQIVSLLSILCLIVITNSRRILVMDEILSGVSVHNRMIISQIMWTFTQVGFQFIINEHGFIPEGSKVFHIEMVNDVSHVKQSYVAKHGVYLQSTGDGDYDYSDEANTKMARASTLSFDEIANLALAEDSDEDEYVDGIVESPESNSGSPTDMVDSTVNDGSVSTEFEDVGVAGIVSI